MRKHILLPVILISSLAQAQQPMKSPPFGAYGRSENQRAQSERSEFKTLKSGSDSIGTDLPTDASIKRKNFGKATGLNLSLMKSGNEGGGGGGGIKLPDGTVLTMAQAGLKFPDNSQDPYYVDAETMGEALNIMSRLEKFCSSQFKGSSCQFALGELKKNLTSNDHDYEKVEVVNPTLFNKMKAEYAKYYKQLNLSGTFVLPAYTFSENEKSRTILFPDFFASNYPQTRAIYLIHEAFFAYYGKDIDLEKVLRAEVAIVDVLKAQTPTTLRAFRDAITTANIGHYLLANKTPEIIGNYLEYLRESGITIPFSALFESNSSLKSLVWGRCEAQMYSSLPNQLAPLTSWGYLKSVGNIEVNPQILSENRGIEASFFKMFFRTALYFSCENLEKNGKAIDYSIDELEFRGTEIYLKSGTLIGGILNSPLRAGYLDGDAYGFQKIEDFKK